MKLASASSLSECANVTVASSRMQVTPVQGLIRQPHPGQRAVPGADLRPRVPPCCVHRRGDPAVRPLAPARDLLQRPPRRRHRRHQPEQLTLIGHHPEIGDHPGAVRDRARQVRQSPGPGHGPGTARVASARDSPPGQARSYRPGAAAAPARHATRHPDHRQDTSSPLDHPVVCTQKVLLDLGPVRTSNTLIVPAQEHRLLQAGRSALKPLHGRDGVRVSGRGPWPFLAGETRHAYQSGGNLRVVRYVRGRDRPRHTAKAFLRRAHGRALPAGPGSTNPLPPTAEPDLPPQPSSHSLVWDWVWVRPRKS